MTHNVDPEYDDSGWTREEMEAQIWPVGFSTGWDDMDEYDNLPDQTAIVTDNPSPPPAAPAV